MELLKIKFTIVYSELDELFAHLTYLRGEKVVCFLVAVVSKKHFVFRGLFSSLTSIETISGLFSYFFFAFDLELLLIREAQT